MADENKTSGDKGVALHQAREEIKALRAQISAIENNNNGTENQTINQNNKYLDLGEVEDLYDLTPQQLSEKLNGAISIAVQDAVKLTAGAVEKKVSETSRQSQVEDVMSKFAIFSDEDQILSELARRELSGKITPEMDVKEVARVADEVAKQISGYKTGGGSVKPSSGAGKVPSIPPVGNVGSVPHLNQAATNKSFKNSNQAWHDAESEASQFLDHLTEEALASGKFG